MTSDSCQKLVVVLGPADPVLESTLVFVGLHVVHTAGNVTVWAPLEWNLSWPAAVVDSDVWPGSLGWDDIRCATSDQSRDVRRRCAVAEQIDSPVRELEPCGRWRSASRRRADCSASPGTWSTTWSSAGSWSPSGSAGGSWSRSRRSRAYLDEPSRGLPAESVQIAGCIDQPPRVGEAGAIIGRQLSALRR